MGLSHVICAVRWWDSGARPGQPTYIGNYYAEFQPLPFQGFAEGDRVCRPDNPTVGVLEHICYEPRDSQGRTWYYAYVLWPNAMRRGEKIFDTHSHVYLKQLRHATPENVAAAEAVVADRLHRQALRYGFVMPRD